MIKLEKVNKYYNKGKSNQIHVIDDTSMVLPNSGIVCLLGPSGCGKTTLLNAIGGLDKVNSGKIYIDDQLMTRFSSSKIDKIRNARIGYIFQNFNLLDDKTVFENVAIALRMIGIKDKEIVTQRVRYCLDQVGIYQYRNKPAGSLSGGQRQRVAIARAIVKNPRIILADEPTGNLDSANTLEIMNIIKTISKDRLVILVTHERKIAEFYSDYVAEMKDGKIVKAYSNDSSRFLDYQLENRIYLKDMPVMKDFAKDDIKVKVYGDEERQADIKLVIRGNNLYIDTGGKLNVIDERSNIEMVDEHYQAMDESVFADHDFDYGAYLPKKYKASYTPVYNFRNMITTGWETVSGFKRIRKVLMMGFVFAAMFALLAISNMLGIFDVQPKDYRKTSGNYITVANPDKNEDLINKVGNMDGVRYVMPGDTLKSLVLPLDDYMQTNYAEVDLDVSVCDVSVLDGGSIVCGSMPEDAHDIVLDKMIVDNFIEMKLGHAVGVDSMEKFIGRSLKVGTLEEYRICGISDTSAPAAYVDGSQVINILTNGNNQMSDLEFGDNEDDEDDVIMNGMVRDIELAKSPITIKKGDKPKALYEAVVNEAYENEVKIGSTLNTKLAGHKLKVVGYYSSERAGDDTYYVTADSIRADYISRQKNMTVYADDVESVLGELDSEGISAKANDVSERESYIHDRRDQLRSAMIVAGIILLISLIEMFLMLRSSFLSRIKEVGTLRAIGLRKSDIYRMFTGEILVITFMTAIPGIAIMYYFLTNLMRISTYLKSMYVLTPGIAISTFIVLLLFNLLAGLIPVFFTMRKTPAEILARTDI